jgi:hypothetical protein
MGHALIKCFYLARFISAEMFVLSRQSLLFNSIQLENENFVSCHLPESKGDQVSRPDFFFPLVAFSTVGLACVCPIILFANTTAIFITPHGQDGRHHSVI